MARMWPSERPQTSQAISPSVTQALYVSLQNLSPQTESQKYLKAQALGVYTDLAQTHWLLVEQSGRSIEIPFLVVVVFWLATIFVSFGLMTPRNATAIVTLVLAAISVSGAFFLILELQHPFDGFIQISSSPMRSVLDRIGS